MLLCGVLYTFYWLTIAINAITGCDKKIVRSRLPYKLHGVKDTAEPDLAVSVTLGKNSVTNHGKTTETNSASLLRILIRIRKFRPVNSVDCVYCRMVQWNRKWQMVGKLFFLIEFKVFFNFHFHCNDAQIIWVESGSEPGSGSGTLKIQNWFLIRIRNKSFRILNTAWDNIKTFVFSLAAFN